MVGPRGLEPQISTLPKRGYQVFTTTYKAVGDCQVLDNIQKSDTSRVGVRVDFRKHGWATAPRAQPPPTPRPHEEQAIRQKCLNNHNFRDLAFFFFFLQRSSN